MIPRISRAVCCIADFANHQETDSTLGYAEMTDRGWINKSTPFKVNTWTSSSWLLFIKSRRENMGLMPEGTTGLKNSLQGMTFFLMKYQRYKCRWEWVDLQSGAWIHNFEIECYLVVNNPNNTKNYRQSTLCLGVPWQRDTCMWLLNTDEVMYKCINSCYLTRFMMSWTQWRTSSRPTLLRKNDLNVNYFS